MSEQRFTLTYYDNPSFRLRPEVLLDNRVSPKARGLACYLLTCSGDWILTVRAMERDLNATYYFVSSALKELVDKGYLKYSKKKILLLRKDRKGVFTTSGK